MSLRVFHIIFVAVSVALCVFVALWGIRQYGETRALSDLLLALVFFPSAAALVIYGKRVFVKLRDLP